MDEWPMPGEQNGCRRSDSTYVSGYAHRGGSSGARFRDAAPNPGLKAVTAGMSLLNIVPAVTGEPTAAEVASADARESGMCLVDGPARRGPA